MRVHALPNCSQLPPPSIHVLCVLLLCSLCLLSALALFFGLSYSHTHRAPTLPSPCPSYPHCAHRVFSLCSRFACSALSASTHCACTVLIPVLPHPSLPPSCALAPPPTCTRKQYSLPPVLHSTYTREQDFLPPVLCATCTLNQYSLTPVLANSTLSHLCPLLPVLTRAAHSVHSVHSAISTYSTRAHPPHTAREWWCSGSAAVLSFCSFFSLAQLILLSPYSTHPLRALDKSSSRPHC